MLVAEHQKYRAGLSALFDNRCILFQTMGDCGQVKRVLGRLRIWEVVFKEEVIGDAYGVPCATVFPNSICYILEKQSINVSGNVFPLPPSVT